ncbi:hypothetical protein HDU96_007017 [Phlyctochytrium bullatum]|nr:hypothetical protein HDU96_007017 [Phlyctochytrium bullatum]
MGNGPSSPDEDSITPQRLREQANVLFKSAKAHSRHAQDAYKLGRHAVAKQHSVLAARLRAQAQRKSKMAADAIFEDRNAGLPHEKIDLRELFVKEATERLRERVEDCKGQGVGELVVFTGVGRYSAGNVHRIRAGVKQFAEEEGIDIDVGVPNAGCVML